ncbi:Nif11-like leader peptide family RiPP precursor [Synechococcus sp. AH-229-G18]|nr:Nif11-like leader peptide family RiPP precursor [Synechococcus sp. AH-229-G18]
MSEERIKAIHERVKVDTSLQKKFKAAPDVETIAAIAAESVFQLDADNSLRMLM